MKLALSALVLCLSPATAVVAQQPAVRPERPALSTYDSTKAWQFPHQVSRARRQQVEAVLSSFRDSCTVQSLISRLGNPDRIEQVTPQTQPLTFFDAGFLAGAARAGHRISYRLVWFVKKLREEPSSTDEFLVAYVRADGRTVRAVFGNGLE